MKLWTTLKVSGNSSRCVLGQIILQTVSPQLWVLEYVSRWKRIQDYRWHCLIQYWECSSQMQLCHWLLHAPIKKNTSFYTNTSSFFIYLFFIRIQHLSSYLRAASQCVGILNTIVGILIYRGMKAKLINSTVSKQHINIPRNAASALQLQWCVVFFT